MSNTFSPVDTTSSEMKNLHKGAGRDIAAGLAEQFANEPDYDRKEEVKLRWKIDLRLIPFLWLNITLPAMDKITPSTGALYGLREDLGLHGTQYAWVGSAFYVSCKLPFLFVTGLLSVCLVWLPAMVLPIVADPSAPSYCQVHVCCHDNMGLCSCWSWFLQ